MRYKVLFIKKKNVKAKQALVDSDNQNDLENMTGRNNVFEKHSEYGTNF